MKMIRTVLCCFVSHNCAQSCVHWYEQFLQTNCFRIRFCVRFCASLVRAISFVLGLVILCLVYCLFVIVWLSVPVQYSAIDCLEKLISEITYFVSSGTLNPTLTHSVPFGDFFVSLPTSLLKQN